jgi:hypothetical protein
MTALVERMLRFRLKMLLEADPYERGRFVGIVAGWWKAAEGWRSLIRMFGVRRRWRGVEMSLEDRK